MKFKNKTVTIILIIVLIMGSLGVVFADNIGNTIRNIVAVVTGVDESDIDLAELKKQIKQIDKEEFLTEDVIEKLEASKDSEKIIDGLKMVIYNKVLTEQQKERFNQYILKNSDYIAVTSLYDVMFEGFFTYGDLDDAIQRYNDGETLDKIIDEFYSKDDNMEPHQYPEGQLEYLVEFKGIQVNELAIAEILSSRGMIDFDLVIDRLCNGEKFSSICEELDIINTEQIMDSVDIYENEVEQCMQAANISEKDAINRISKAKKAGVSDKDIVEHVKAKKSNGNVKKRHQMEMFSK